MFLLRGSIRKREPADARINRSITALATWDDAKLHEVGIKDQDNWILCGEANGCMQHLAKSCKATKDLRKEHGLEHVIQHIPLPLCLGIPPAMTADCDGTFWGTNSTKSTKEDRVPNKKANAEATTIREKEAATFTATKDESSSDIAAIEQAAVTLKDDMGDPFCKQTRQRCSVAP